MTGEGGRASVPEGGGRSATTEIANTSVTGGRWGALDAASFRDVMLTFPDLFLKAKAAVNGERSAKLDS